MKIAYILSVYKDFDYLAKVIKMLDEPWADFYVHIDRKSKINIKKYIEKNNLQKANFIKRINVNWGGFSQIQATINLFKAVEKSGIKYDRIIFITDGEFPVWSNSRIYNFFENNMDKEFMTIANPLQYGKGFEYSISRLNTYTFFDSFITKFIPRQKFIMMMAKWQRFQRDVLGISRKLLPLTYYRSNAKFYITYDFMLFVLDYIKNNPGDVRTYKYTACADEIFFTTILMNSKYKKNLINNLYRYHIWNNDSPTAKILTLEDKDSIINHKYMIAAKLVEGESDDLFEYLSNNRIEN